MKRAVIGLNLKYLNVAFIAILVTAVAVFLPFIAQDTQSVMIFNVALGLMNIGQLKAYGVILILAIVATFISAIFAIYTFVKPAKMPAYVWLASNIVQTVTLTLTVFGTKRALDGTGLLDEAFMVKDFGIGFWIALIASYISLWYTLKIAKSHSGYIVLVIMSIIWLFPIVWLLITSFRAEQGYYVGYFIPKGFTFENYTNLFAADSVIPFAKWWTNTFIVASVCCVLCTVMVLATAFILSRTRFKGRVTIMKVMLVIGMFPGTMSMVALYNILKGMGLNQSLWALIVMGVAGAAMGYQVCKGFFDTISKSLDEAAIIDGANRFQIFIHVILPLGKPMIINTMLGAFMGPWSDYIFPSMLFGDKQASYTVAVGLKWLTDFQRIDHYYTQFAAGSVMVAVPIVILFICLQKYYVEGLSGSVKG